MFCGNAWYVCHDSHLWALNFKFQIPIHSQVVTVNTTSTIINKNLHKLWHYDWKTFEEFELYINVYHIKMLTVTMWIWLFSYIMIDHILYNKANTYCVHVYVLPIRITPYYCLSFIKQAYWHVKYGNRTNIWL